MGFGNILLEGPPFAHVIPKGCLPGPREKVKKKKKPIHGYYFLKLCNTYASLGTSALEKRLIKLHKELRRRKVQRLLTPFPWNPKLGIFLAWPSPKNVEKGKSPRTCRVSKSVQNLVTPHLHHDRPGLTPASLFWVVTIILKRSPGSTPAPQHSVFKTAAEWCFYNFKIQVNAGQSPAHISPTSCLSLREKARVLTTVYKVVYEPDLATVSLRLQLCSPCSLC